MTFVVQYLFLLNLKFFIQQDLDYPNTCVPAESQKCSDKWICLDEWSSLIYIQSFIELL